MPYCRADAITADLVHVAVTGVDHKTGENRMSNETNIQKVGNWVIRQRVPVGKHPQKLLLLLHGWTGDENSMWIFTPRLPDSYVIISPRAPYSTPLGGFSWHSNKLKGWPVFEDFLPVVEELLNLVSSINVPNLNVDRFDLIGFSQGAALGYIMALMYPDKIGKIAGLSGFLPANTENEITTEVLTGKKVFVAHGKLDDMVPIDKARRVVQVLQLAGAEVVYCEDDVGHKLSAGCFRGMDAYFE